MAEVVATLPSAISTSAAPRISDGSRESPFPSPDVLTPDAPPPGIPTPRRGSVVTAKSIAASSSSGSRATPTASSFVSRASGKGKAKAGDEIEMIQFSTALPGQPGMERQKTDDALARWRKWVIDNPAGSAESSPLAIKVSVAPHQSSVSPPSSARHIGNSSSAPLHSPSDLTSEPSRSAPITPGDFDIYNTESIRILRDVELAIDPNYQPRASNAASSSTPPAPTRQLSTHPRLSSRDNPFAPIASRLGSRRVRPIVLELIHALGHYVDALWTLRRPNTPCPWIADPSLPKPLPGEGKVERRWTSKMITAVQQGKASGHVVVPPTPAELDYWQEEVSWALADVSTVVGIVKGGGWAFVGALQRGEYGEVEDENVLGPNGEGGNVVRLLNDLEEALWGDAPPRATDLAYELPYDFDPYALPSASDLNTGLHRVPDAPSPVLAFLSNSSSMQSELVASPDAQSIEHLSDLIHIASPSFSPIVSPLHEAAPRKSGSAGGDGSYWGFKNPEGESWEEIGKRRHQEWLASRQASN